MKKKKAEQFLRFQRLIDEIERKKLNSAERKPTQSHISSVSAENKKNLRKGDLTE